MLGWASESAALVRVCPRAEPSASTTMIEGQAVVTAELRGDGNGPPPEHETQRLVDTLLNGAGFFIAR